HTAGRTVENFIWTPQKEVGVSLFADTARKAIPRLAKRKTFGARRSGPRRRSVSSAAQRGKDDHFVVCLQTMVQASDAVPVHEETNMRANAILFVDNTVAHPRVAGLKKLQQLHERFARAFDLPLTAGVREKRAWQHNAHHKSGAAVTE
ncbi:MAG TPA: hypothetical protein VET30_08445, partial [Pseudoxanthomonas sp.]|nr:hypothetical protein [Pseudoxanthomonas sp.]